MGIPPEFLIGIMLIGISLLGIGVAISLADSGGGDEIGDPTDIPAPTLTNGALLTENLMFFAAEDMAFSVAAGEDFENDDQTITRCTPVQVFRQAADSEYLGFDNSGYWVYTRTLDDAFLNGWLPLDNLVTSLPDDCAPLELEDDTSEGSNDDN